MKIIVIGGKAGSGKTTFGECLRDYLKDYGYKPCVMHITSPLYEYARNYFYWDNNEGNKPREFLQKMGIEIIQQKMGKKDFLLNRLFEDIEVLSNFFDTFIITDARLSYEFKKIKEKYSDVTSIKMIRENYDNNLSYDEKNHITEKDLDDYNDFDYYVTNKDYSDLEESALEITKEINRRNLW